MTYLQFIEWAVKFDSTSKQVHLQRRYRLSLRRFEVSGALYFYLHLLYFNDKVARGCRRFANASLEEEEEEVVHFVQRRNNNPPSPFSSARPATSTKKQLFFYLFFVVVVWFVLLFLSAPRPFAFHVWETENSVSWQVRFFCAAHANTAVAHNERGVKKES